MIFLNLFLAILLENFEIPEDEPDHDGGVLEKVKEYGSAKWRKIQEKFVMKFEKLFKINRVKINASEDIERSGVKSNSDLNKPDNNISIFEEKTFVETRKTPRVKIESLPCEEDEIPRS